MSYSLTTHEIPDFMTRFWHANCMTSLRGHRKRLQLGHEKKKMQRKCLYFILPVSNRKFDSQPTHSKFLHTPVIN